MNVLVHIVTLLATMSAFVVGGYWLAGRLVSISPAQRLATASLVGLAAVLWSLSVVNLFRGIDGWSAVLCMWPLAVTLASTRWRSMLWKDLKATVRRREGRVGALVGCAFLALLTSPELSRTDSLYFDATPNHDGYFWITGAKHLQDHSYLEFRLMDRDRPWANSTSAYGGWRPVWGRTGAEGLIALVATLTRSDPIGIYFPATAALYLPWVAAVYLVVRTFWADRLTTTGIAALTGLQPLFFFFRANANLPNLLGTLLAAALLVATARALRDPSPCGVWRWIIVLAQSALLFSYHEMWPFVALPCGLLVLRALLADRDRPQRPLLTVVWATIGAHAVGVVVNPATPIRAFGGFLHSLSAARADQTWFDTFSWLDPLQYAPAMATLSINAQRYVGPAIGALATGVLLAAALFALRGARDRVGALVSLSGGAALLLYTVFTDFSYGWQKTMQFSATAFAAMLPVAALNVAVPGRQRQGWVERLLAAAVAALFVLGLIFHRLEAEKFSQRKTLSPDWLALRAAAATFPPGAGVLVEPATYRTAFFHGMWASYFLRDVRVVFSSRGERNGGYLADTVRRESPADGAAPHAVLVSRAWAETFDANSPRAFSGRDVVLLEKANRVWRLDGFDPTEGIPQKLSRTASIELTPHSPSELQLTLAAADSNAAGSVRWQITRHLGHVRPQVFEVSGRGPWTIAVPLVGGQTQRLEFTATADSSAAPEHYTVSALRIVGVP